MSHLIIVLGVHFVINAIFIFYENPLKLFHFLQDIPIYELLRQRFFTVFMPLIFPHVWQP